MCLCLFVFVVMFTSLFLTLLLLREYCLSVLYLYLPPCCICCICIYLLVPDKDVLSALGPIVQQLRLCQSQSSPGPPPTVVSEPDLLKNSLNIINILGVLIMACGNLWRKLVDIISVISVSKNHQGQTHQDNLYIFRGWGCQYLATLCTCTRIWRTGLSEVPVIGHSLYLFCICICISHLKTRLNEVPDVYGHILNMFPAVFCTCNTGLSEVPIFDHFCICFRILHS